MVELPICRRQIGHHWAIRSGLSFGLAPLFSEYGFSSQHQQQCM